MLYSAGFTPQYWEYVFYFYLRIRAVFIHGSNTPPPQGCWSSSVPLTIACFCHLFTLSMTRRDDKLTTENISEGKLMGYGGSMKTLTNDNILAKRRARATPATFEEAQLSTLEAGLSPNSRDMWGELSSSKGTDILDTAAVMTPLKDFCVFTDSPYFIKVRTLMVPIKCTFDDYDIFFDTDPMSHSNIIMDVAPFYLVSQMEWNTLLQFHTVIQVDTFPVFMVREFQLALATLDVTTHASFQLIVAPYCPGPTDQQAPLSQVTLDQLLVIKHVIHPWDLSDPVMLITADNTANTADGKGHTHRKCLQGPERDFWIEAECAQLDKNDSYGMHGVPIIHHATPLDADMFCII
jgi:hypothetical protein